MAPCSVCVRMIDRLTLDGAALCAALRRTYGPAAAVRRAGVRGELGRLGFPACQAGILGYVGGRPRGFTPRRTPSDMLIRCVLHGTRQYAPYGTAEFDLIINYCTLFAKKM